MTDSPFERLSPDQCAGLAPAPAREPAARELLAREHGAMEHGPPPPADLGAVRRYRLARLRAEMAKAELGGLLLFDPIAIRYATDSTNMQVWCGHYEVRACLLVAGGPLVLYDYARHPHLIEGLEGIDDYRVLPPLHYMFSGAETAAAARALAAETRSLLREHAGANRRLAVDRCSPTLGQALQQAGLEILDATPVTEQARAIKSPGEMTLVRAAVAACDKACGAMKAALRPGITEAQLWAKLHEANIALGGEWIETRLLTSGPRTNPWFRECSQRVIEKGDLVCFDTDLIGPYGYCADISRSWLCGDGKPSEAQRRLYASAFEQLQHNLELVKPGRSFREISAQSWPIPARYAERRYGVMLHGVGLADEWPSVYFAPDAAKNIDGAVEPGMVLCVESYVGEVGGHEGVKLEEQLLVTEGGAEPLSTLPLETDWL